MSKRVFKKIMQGIEEARAYLEGAADKNLYRIHVGAKAGHPSQKGEQTRTRDEKEKG